MIYLRNQSEDAGDFMAKEPMKIQYISVDEIIPYENNPRANENAVPFLMNSIQDFDFRNPILLDKNKVIICGHTRLIAAKELGYTEVPCIIADDLSPEKVDALRLADNRISEMSGWSLEKLDLCLEPLKVDFDMTRYGFLDLPDDIEVYEGEDNSIQLPDIGVDRGVKVMVMLDSQEQAEALAERLTDEGYRCKVLS